jgi:hypothetical protein
MFCSFGILRFENRCKLPADDINGSLSISPLSYLFVLHGLYSDFKDIRYEAHKLYLAWSIRRTNERHQSCFPLDFEDFGDTGDEHFIDFGVYSAGRLIKSSNQIVVRQTPQFI